VLCNAEIKFKAFLDHAMRMGATRIATGHYAGVRERDGRFELLRAADTGKDQSYFLHRLSQAQLSRVMFPLSQIAKPEVRRIAAEAGLPNHAKKDSTGICFIGERPFREFLNRYLPKKPGVMRTPEGRKVGEHVGLAFYTIGQRKGIGLGGVKGAPEEPWFVAQKDIATNELIVVQGHDHPLLLRRSLHAQDLAWVSGEAPGTSIVYGAKTRYRQPDSPCHVAGLPGDALDVEFDAPQWAVTPGQSVVIYRDEVCLGGGIIQ